VIGFRVRVNTRDRNHRMFACKKQFIPELKGSFQGTEHHKTREKGVQSGFRQSLRAGFEFAHLVPKLDARKTLHIPIAPIEGLLVKKR